MEVINHKAYELLEAEYERVGLDYVILQLEGEYEGLQTHKQAVIDAFEILNSRYADCELSFEVDPAAMAATPIEAAELLQLPPDGYRYAEPEGNRAFSIPRPLPYWFAFLEPTYGTPYLTSDFVEFNDALFPNKDALEAFSWSDDFSNYFDEGKEWWGTALWSAFDPKTGLMVIIGASLTD